MTDSSLAMDSALIIGNGESRSWYTLSRGDNTTYSTWGCNAIYRDGEIDMLVATDPAMQQEIYESGYAQEHTCFFMDWSILPSEIGSTFLVGYDIPKELVFENPRLFMTNGGSYLRDSFVIRGKDPSTVQEKVKEALEKFPHLDGPDLVQKMEKDTGVWITWVEEDDAVIDFDFPRGWSTGNSAIHLACQNGAKEVYLLGFDLSEYNSPLNNIYKGTKNYLPVDAKGFNSINWLNQMKTIFKEFIDVQFYWVDPTWQTWPRSGWLKGNSWLLKNNVHYSTKKELCEKLQIL